MVLFLLTGPTTVSYRVFGLALLDQVKMSTRRPSLESLKPGYARAPSSTLLRKELQKSLTGYRLDENMEFLPRCRAELNVSSAQPFANVAFDTRIQRILRLH